MTELKNRKNRKLNHDQYRVPDETPTESVMGLNLESLPLNVNQGSFGREVLFYQGSVFVAFWAPYSIPCHKEALMLREITLKRPRSLKVVKVNCEVEKELTRKYRVHELPGHILFHNGKEMGRTSGEKNREEIETWLDQNSSMEIVV